MSSFTRACSAATASDLLAGLPVLLANLGIESMAYSQTTDTQTTASATACLYAVNSLLLRGCPHSSHALTVRGSVTDAVETIVETQEPLNEL